MSHARIRYQLAVSLDGFIGPEDGSADWLDPYGEVAMEIVTPFMEEIGGLIMGRVTWEQMRSFGPGPFDSTPTVVLTSNSALDVPDNARLCTAGPKAAIATLEDMIDRGDIWLFGGGKTATGFLNEDLVDLIELTVVPVVLGEGLPLFPGLRNPLTFDLVESRAGKLGTISTVYARRPAET